MSTPGEGQFMPEQLDIGARVDLPPNVSASRHEETDALGHDAIRFAWLFFHRPKGEEPDGLRKVHAEIQRKCSSVAMVGPARLQISDLSQFANRSSPGSDQLLETSGAEFLGESVPNYLIDTGGNLAHKPRAG